MLKSRHPLFNFSHLSTFEEPGVAPHIHTFSCNSLSLSLVTVSASKSAKHVEIGYVFNSSFQIFIALSLLAVKDITYLIPPF